MHRLTKGEIKIIIEASLAGETLTSIAARLKCDRSTVAYHVEKYRDASITGTGYIALMKAEIQHECIHPSLKCFCCGKMDDILRREDRVRIRVLEQEVLRLGGKLPAV